LDERDGYNKHYSTHTTHIPVTTGYPIPGFDISPAFTAFDISAFTALLWHCATNVARAAALRSGFFS
jgi:hypothetical protein